MSASVATGDGRRVGTPMTVAAVVLAVLFAAVSGLAPYLSSALNSKTLSEKMLVIIPLALAVGIALLVLAMTRFAVFLMGVLLIRASVDVTRLSGSSAGNTQVNTSAARALQPSVLLGVLCIVVALVWLAVARYRLGALPGSRFRTALLAFFFAGLVSVLGAAHLSASALEALRLLAAVLMFVVLEQLMIDRQAMRQVLAACIASAVFPVAFTLFGVAIGHPRSETKGHFTRLIGTFGQSNDYGRYLMVIIIFGAAMYPHVSKRMRKWLAALLAGAAICMLLSLTITAVIGTVVGLVVLGLTQNKRILQALMIAGVLSLAVAPQFVSRFTSATGVSASHLNSGAVNSSSSGSLSWRFSYWAQVLPLANSNPVTGIGLAMTQYQTNQAKQPHNDFVRAYVETGLIGFLTYCGMLISMMSLGRRAVAATVRGTFERSVAAGFWGVAIAFSLVSAAANVLTNIALVWYVMAFAAAAAAVLRQARTRAALAETAEPPPALAGAPGPRAVLAGPADP